MNEILFQPLGQAIAVGEGLTRVADIDPRLTRTHYFDGRLLTAEDLTRDQIYLDQRLRELGRVLGSGILSGLELTFNRFTGVLTLSPGQGISAAGRVLELGAPLTVDLNDRALIAIQNNGQQRRFNRALYAVVLRYIDVGTDIAEVFPKDLAAKRGFDYALITESVQLGLVPLPLPLSQQSDLHLRARLIREFLGDSSAGGLIPEDAVALGVLAIADDTPQWLDAELLRQPVRAEAGPGDYQADLSRQYEALLADVLSRRAAGQLGGDFHASDYFSLLPPVGSVPKDALDPVNGRQGYFPENYHIAIAPIRQSDVALVREESLRLPPIDLNNGEPVDIVVLVPLSNQDYGHFATALERAYDPVSRRLPQLDLLRLKLYPTRPVHLIDNDAIAWGNIWTRFGANNPLYVRRPTRAAETAVSGIVLALGMALPLPAPSVPNVVDDGGLLEDEGTAFLRRFNYARLAQLRPPVNADGEESLETLQELFQFPAMVDAATRILARIERHYDGLIWQTLQELADGGQLEAFLSALLAAEPAAATGSVVAQMDETIALSATLRGQWAALVP